MSASLPLNFNKPSFHLKKWKESVSSKNKRQKWVVLLLHKKEVAFLISSYWEISVKELEMVWTLIVDNDEILLKGRHL